jgi:T5SS/PEP-CTERM-associated repeat protein
VFTRRAICLGVPLACLWLGSPANAALKTWKLLGVTDNWSSPGNWNGGLPVAGDDVLIAPNDGLARTVNYNISAPALAGFRVDLTGSGVERTTLQMSGNTLASNNFQIGEYGRARVNQSGGSFSAASDGAIGNNTGGNGEYNLSGTASLSLARDLYIGNIATSSGVVYQNGGTVTVTRDVLMGKNAGSTGVYAMSGGTLSVGGELNVGINGAATFSQSGGIVNVAGNLVSKHSPGAGGVTIDGGSLKTSHLLLEGRYVQTGGNVDATFLGVGRSGSANGTVEVWGGVLNVSGGISASGTADSLHPTITFQAGAKVTSLFGRIGSPFAEVVDDLTVVRVRDAGTRWDITGDLGLFIGENTRGALYVDKGATVSAERILMTLASELYFEGTVMCKQIDDYDGRFPWRSGTLCVDVYNGHLKVPTSGVLSPGRSPNDSAAFGRTLIVGTYNAVNTDEPAGALSIEIGGPTAEVAYDYVEATGDANLDGNLQLSMVNGYRPGPSDTFTILRSLTRVYGNFRNVGNGQRLTTADGIGSFVVNYGAGSPYDPKKVILSSFQLSKPGDFDLDGDVDGADFLRWQRGQSPTPLSATDLAHWKANYAKAVPAATPVPEPATNVFAAIALLAIVGLRPTRRSV